MLGIVGVAGTFGPLHKGHKILLRKAFEVGEHVLVALTTESMLQRKEVKGKIPPYEIRKHNLEQFLNGEGYQGRYKIIPLEDPYGVAITLREQEGIVVSEDTVKGAEQINQIRQKKGMKPLEIVTIKLIHAQDGNPISSTRIRKNEIDPNGNLAK
ncbi:MAG: pantetheine-phosphate adenylyltransferase [Candidatus Helarchaeota archaeon]|nr:pantetheine-phosphate adenylyltransferase [Candidatus Helarchaeota archaeon]